MLLVADALTGQDAVNLARSFDQRVGLTGIVLTRVDGDGRGGAALSMRAVTNKPIKLIGTGEKLDALEEFDPARIAGRILGMGDIVALVEKAAANIDAEKAMRAAEKMRKGKFDLGDLREQLQQMQAMGGMSGLLGMMPGVAKMKNQIADAGLDDKLLKRQMAIIDSMTPQERRNPDILKASRKKRIAAGSGTTPEDDQQASENAPRHGRHDEGDGQRQARPARRASARSMGFGSAACRRRSRWRRSPRRCRAAHCRRACRAARCRRPCRICRRTSRACPGSAAESFLDCRALPGLGKKEVINVRTSVKKGN